jgi:prevent-host-death family protein
MRVADQERAGKAGQGSRAEAVWRLQDAKARLSEVVRLAREQGPQRVTVHGRDAVVVVAAEAYDRLQPPLTGEAIVEALRRSPLEEVEIERLSVRAPVQEVEL